MPDFRISFATRPYEELDQLALLACQSYNLGNASDWFGEWRGGLYGFYARLFGVATHYWELHAWSRSPRFPTHVEYHLATLFFNMDSALECITFALNALGFAVRPAGFRDVMDEGAQRRISPFDILGIPDRSPAVPPLAGYADLLPTTQAVWQANRDLIARLQALHDASKHRRTIFVGGQGRSDPPPGFDPSTHPGLGPLAEIILKHDPKMPAAKRAPAAMEKGDLLEEMMPVYVSLINETGHRALADARKSIPLTHAELRGENPSG